MKLTANAYTEAGVDVEAGYEVVERIKKYIKKTERLGVMGVIGGFDGCFNLSVLQLREPVLALGIDSVGMRLAVIVKAGKHDTIEIDCVATCINDVLVQDTEPLYFLDYLATGKNNPTCLENVVKGVVNGCAQGNMVLVGGETAEVSGMCSGNDYDLAGFAVGIVEKSQLLTRETINPGDVLLGIASNGIHSNGCSPARKIFFEQQQFSLSSKLPGLKETLGEVLLEPTKIYVPSLLPLTKEKKIKGAAYITGGGFVENVPRMLPESMAAEVKLGTWPTFPIFGCPQKYGEISMMKTCEIFNIGIGMVLAVEETEVKEIIHEIEQTGEKAYEIGKAIAKEKYRVMFTGEER